VLTPARSFLRTHLDSSSAHLKFHLREMFLPLPLATIVVAPGSILSCPLLLRRKLIQKETGVTDVPLLGISRPADRKIQGTAVVCEEGQSSHQ
jgi:hypothetical protein